MDTVASHPHALGNAEDASFIGYCDRMAQDFLERVKAGGGNVFRTDVDPDALWDAYLGSYPETTRQYHNCSACRHFIKQYGGLVTIGDDGAAQPALWTTDGAPGDLLPAIARMTHLIARARVVSPFYTSMGVLGEPRTGVWRHFYLRAHKVHTDRVKTAWQAMAEKREDFGTVCRALAEFDVRTVDTAVNLLKSDSLYRSEKVLGQAEWLQKLHAAHATALGVERRRNVVWRAIAEAPAGFCHPRSSMIGTLLEDIAAGKSFEECSRAFAAKMHPLRYQRPQAAPTGGAIRQAEELFEKLGLGPALARRFMLPEEIRPRALWLPQERPADPPAGGLFGHLQPKRAAPPASLVPPPSKMTWERFRFEVLPGAVRLEVRAPLRGGYTSFLTAVDPTAPPLLQWDHPEDRNPVSWYYWHGGSPASQFGVAGGEYVPVTAVTLKPSQWGLGGAAMLHQGRGVMFVIEGARETRQPHLCLFPECLRGELHGVRSVIEAHSRSREAEGLHGPQVAGVMITDNRTDADWGLVVRVHDDRGMFLDYTLDRWA